MTKGSENLFGSIPQWRVAGYDAMLADIRRVIGETTEAERAAAAEGESSPYTSPYTARLYGMLLERMRCSWSHV